MSDCIIQLIAALVGSFGFSLFFNSSKKILIPATIGGLLGWGVYLLLDRCCIGVFLASVGSAAFLQIYSEVFARVLKSPTTVILIPSLIPLVPGGSLYYTMYYAALSDWSSFRFYCKETVLVAFGIAVGTSFVSAILLLLPRKNYNS